MKQVVATRPESLTLTLDELSNDKGYVLEGDKGDFIIGRQTDGRYIWVRLNPTKAIAKPVHAFDTLKEAIKSKLDKGYDVFEYTNADVE